MRHARRAVIAIALSSCFAQGCSTDKEGPPAPPPAPDVAITPPVSPQPFDLGGPCLESSKPQRLVLTGKQEEEFRESKNWAALIEGAKQDVRNRCSNSFLWQKLFLALVDGHRYTEAVSVLNDMTTRGFAMPNAAVSKAGRSFLASNEFKQSTVGADFAAREARIQDAVRQAEARLASMPEKEKPPSVYRSIGACPFECCTYREWKTTAAIELREAIGSSQIVATVPAGVSVTGITGEVHVEPEPYAILADLGALKTGNVIFFLDNRGEGYVNYWYDGKFNPELGVDDGLFFYTDEDCMAGRGEGACSLRKLRPERKFSSEWWVRIRTSTGKEGWVLNTGQFENMDACG